MSFAITRGVTNKPFRVVIYGPEGIGKTSLAACFPEPLFSDTEGSTLRYDIRRIIPLPDTWELLIEHAQFVRDNPSICKTYVVDTADWAELKARKHICNKYKKTGIEDFGYGQGYTYVSEEVGKFLNILTEIFDKGINVVLTAHAAISKFEQPDAMGAYDRWELKMHKKVASQLKEWADMVLFCNYETYVVSQNNQMLKNKATGGKRVMYTCHTPSWDAKNRSGLPDKLPMEYASIRDVIEYSVKQEAKPEAKKPVPDERVVYDRNPEGVDHNYQGIPDELLKLMLTSEVAPEEIMYVVGQEGYFPQDMPIKDYPTDFVLGWIVAEWDTLLKRIRENREETPF